MSMLDLSLKKQYDFLTKTSSIAGAIAMRNLLKKGWEGITHKKPPINPAAPSVIWREALLWGAATGMAIGITKVVTRRLSASAWRKYKKLPPMEM
jgi:hypothetical protein